MYEILVTDPEYLSGDARRILDRVGHVTARRMSRGGLLRAIPNVDALFVRVDTSVDSELLRRAKKLRVIGSATTGLNHIDTAAAKRLGIKIVSLHGAHTISTAEHTMALILALCRNIHRAHESVRRGRWERHRFIGTELNGKVLGLVGLGRIGNAVAGYAKAFGMRVIAYDPYVTSKRIESVKSLDQLLRKSDIISIHSSMLIKDTKGMIGFRQFKKLKEGAFLINTARAEIVDRGALLKALGSGRLAGAAFDVFENEPIRGVNEPLVRYARGHENLLLTPHIGASTKEAVHAASVEIARGIERELRK